MPSTVPSTRTKSPQRKLQDGQAIVLIALLILVLFGMLGLAIDSGRSYVDRRDQQAAVDAAALAAGDWYDNYPDYPDVSATTIPQATLVYQNDLHLYGAPSQTTTHNPSYGLNNQLTKDTWTDTWASGYTLTITAVNTLFNGYQFEFDSTHQFPLAFMQIFGGPPNVTIVASAGSIVGNQRQTPALLTLDSTPGDCGVGLGGNGSLTVLGDVYSNSGVCVSSALHLAGNCYGAAGAQCSSASYYCYNASPGFVPYPPPCNPGDVQGSPVVPAPTLPDPGYISPSWPYYNATSGVQLNRGSYTEMTPGTYNSFALNGGDGCYFLDAGIYTWNGGYSSHGGLVSNELKSPNEESWSAPGTTAGSIATFWSPGGCDGTFTAAPVSVPGGYGMKHGAGGGVWGVELTSVRYDTFKDPVITSSSAQMCFGSPGCRRESAPSACTSVSTTDDTSGPQGINVTITQNAPGAQYYNVYLDRNGCDGNPNNFAYAGTYLAPGWIDAGGPPATATGVPGWTGVIAKGTGGYCGAPVGTTVTICNVSYNDPNFITTHLCFAQVRGPGCETPDDETKPQCFQSCPPSASTPQENAPMALQYPPLYTGGDVANENYCVISPNPGDPNAPCTTAKVTPGAVQFYFPNNQCMDQNGGGYTHVFSGEQYNWIVIYSPPSSSCSTQKLNGNAFTQYIGTIYTPASSWDILGTDKAPLAGQVICYTANVTGNGSAGIDFNPNYAPAPPAARLIN
jgi:hypothetical protein